MKMFKLYNLLLIALFLLSIPKNVFATDGDTIKINAIQFGGSRDTWLQMPDKNKKFSKVLMNYKLRCPPGKPCGEWDYDVYVYFRDSYAPSFRIDSSVVDTLRFMKNQTYKYTAKIVNDNLVLDSTANKARLLEFYEDKVNLTQRTSSMLVYPTYYKYTYNSTSKKIDSVMASADSTLVLRKTKVDFNDKVTFWNSKEIMRYITPYGNGLSLGEGFTWVMDVTDFLPMMKGKVNLFAPNGQEDLELTFDFIEGTPARDVIENYDAWSNYYLVYNDKTENYLKPIQFDLKENEKMAKLKVIQTGHGFAGSEENCSEFCKKNAYVKINGAEKYSRPIWRECGDNPIYPQGGTWLLDRTNWCPGAEVKYHDYEITPHIGNDKSFNIDYDMEFFNTPQSPNGSNWVPNWRVKSYIVTYGDYNFQNDVEILDIISPSTKSEHFRYNPICSNPLVFVRNNVKKDVTSIEFEYGLKGADKKTYTWNGKITSMDTLSIYIPDVIETPENLDANTELSYEIKVLKVNGQNDEYFANSSASSKFLPTPVYGKNINLSLKTSNYDLQMFDNAPSPYMLALQDQDGKILYSLDNTENNKTYDKSMELAKGCYKVTLANSYGYGLTYIFIQQDGKGNPTGFKPGVMNLNDGGGNLWKYKSDFGNYITHYFKVGDLPTIQIDKDTVDFGEVKINEKKTMSFVIKAENSKGIKINKIDINLGASKGYTLLNTIPAIDANGTFISDKDSMIVNIEFAPKSAGSKIANLIINSNDSKSSSKVVKLVGNNPSSSIEDFISDSQSIKLNISENPIYGNAQISFSSEFENTIDAEIFVVNYLGQTVLNLFNGSISDFEQKIDFENKSLSNGSYLIILKTAFASKSLPIVISK